MSHTRREFLLGSAAAAASVGVSIDATAQSQPANKRPNILIYFVDQMRWDFLQWNRLNPTPLTPNLDRMAKQGCNFNSAITNQPVCAPARSVLFTSRFATETGVWHNGIPLANEKGKELPTFAHELRKAGYSANYFGKWHLGPRNKPDGDIGKTLRPYRGGFDDVWEASNGYEHTTHPYEGTIWDADNNPMEYKDQYRVDYITDRVVNFLKQKHDKPFLAFVSQLEPHQQNDLDRPIAPKGYAEKFKDQFVPADLRATPGSWASDLPDYYGCIARLDESVGRVQKTLEEQGIADNTVVIFTSDHGCHFRTRNAEYKRSPHNASIRVPFLIWGPGFNHSMVLDQLVGIIDIAPTVLDIAGVQVPSSFKGRSFAKLPTSDEARNHWDNTQYIQISESTVGRALRTAEWTYVVEDKSADIKTASASKRYTETMLYNQFADPAEQTNLIGNKRVKEATDKLRELLLAKMEAAGEARAEIVPHGEP